MRITLVTTLGVIAQAALAHHSASPHFDLEQVLELDGAVTELRFVNPHAYVYFEVVAESGETAEWRCELGSAVELRRSGWTEQTFVPGQRLFVNASPARREDHHCYTNFFTLADGTMITRQGSLLDTAASAETEAIERPAVLGNGQPNLGGPWTSPGMGPRPNLPEPTEAGRAAAASYERIYDDPAVNCHPGNIVTAWTWDTPTNDIYQEDNAITLQYGYMDLVRRIHLDRTEHPAEIVPSVTGHSIGWWEGDELVVDTMGFGQGVLYTPTGLMHSDAMHVIERFRVEPDGMTLVREYVASDPAFLQSDFTGEQVMQRLGESYTPYDCTELSGANNRRPIR